MKEDWEKKYRAVLMERVPALQQFKIEEARKAIMQRRKEGQSLGAEWDRLENAIKMLNLLRDRT